MPNAKSPWQVALSDLITDPEELLAILQLDSSLLPAARQAARLFPLKVPRDFVARMQIASPDDPLLRQVLPLHYELETHPGFIHDPLQESEVNPVPGLLHKYHGRVLVMLTGACAIHCRYCFRRHFPYDDNMQGKAGWEAIFRYIQANNTISEVILSGGDPLAVNDKMLRQFTDELATIPHVKRLRIHSRVPVVLPQRITESFLTWLTDLKLQPILILHANHAQEISTEVKQAMLRLRETHIPLLNQAVLLKGVNDEVETLIELSETLFSAHVLPYYLHLLDRVAGVAHFEVSRDKALILHDSMSKKLPGYLVPRLVYEEPNAHSKTLLSTGLYTS